MQHQDTIAPTSATTNPFTEEVETFDLSTVEAALIRAIRAGKKIEVYSPDFCEECPEEPDQWREALESFRESARHALG